MARWIDTDDLRKIAADLQAAPWYETQDMIDLAAPALIVAAGEIDRMRRQFQENA